ncbi:MAG: Fe-S cluster assembly protein SufD [Bacteroidaceae bacterium]|nr:Fe-S cluster assembly protein SufD [Bacteroidaceae bacterium]
MSEQQYIEFYSECRDMIMSKSTAVMNNERDKAFELFKQYGFPSQKVERYKYTDVDKAFAPNYGILFTPLGIAPSSYIFSLKDAPKDMTAYYNRLADTSDGITLLNTMLAHECLLIYVPKNTKVEKPINVDNWIRGAVPSMMNRRLLVVLESGADATVIVGDHATDQQAFLTTQVVEVFCHDNSRLDLYEIEETTPGMNRFSNVYIHTENDCNVRHSCITLHNGTTRNLCDVSMEGQYTEVTLNGCAIASATQHIDNNTLIRHIAPNCTSNELYKYVVDEQAVGAFAGKILVEKDAQKTSSQETNNNLCASPEARMYSQPMLEIYADDVKCAHGSTVGVMDETALFYMRQRGIPEEQARMLLKNAFMGQVIDQISYEPLRSKLYVKVEKRFLGELEKCKTCNLCK